MVEKWAMNFMKFLGLKILAYPQQNLRNLFVAPAACIGGAYSSEGAGCASVKNGKGKVVLTDWVSAQLVSLYQL